MYRFFSINMDTQILLKVSSVSDLEKLNAFLESTNITSKVVSSNVIPEMIDHFYTYKPTQEFKDFCGSECLNRFGLISLNSAKEIVLQYSKRNALYNSTTIVLDQTLTKILNTNDREISHEEIFNRIKELFKKH